LGAERLPHQLELEEDAIANRRRVTTRFGGDVSVFREHADAREPHQVARRRLRRRRANRGGGGGRRRERGWRGGRRSPANRKVARGGQGNGIVGQRAGVEFDRLFV